jgi:hypothetical protein
MVEVEVNCKYCDKINVVSVSRNLYWCNGCYVRQYSPVKKN